MIINTYRTVNPEKTNVKQINANKFSMLALQTFL